MVPGVVVVDAQVDSGRRQAKGEERQSGHRALLDPDP